MVITAISRSCGLAVTTSSQRSHVGDASLPRHGVEVTRILELLEIEGTHGACLVRDVGLQHELNHQDVVNGSVRITSSPRTCASVSARSFSGRRPGPLRVLGAAPCRSSSLTRVVRGAAAAAGSGAALKGLSPCASCIVGGANGGAGGAAGAGGGLSGEGGRWAPSSSLLSPAGPSAPPLAGGRCVAGRGGSACPLGPALLVLIGESTVTCSRPNAGERALQVQADEPQPRLHPRACLHVCLVPSEPAAWISEAPGRGRHQ